MGNIHAEVEDNFFATNPRYKVLLRPILADFSITWAGRRRHVGSDFAGIFLKPEDHINEMFGFDREVLLILTEYESLEPRIFQAIDSTLNELPARGRVDPLVVVLAGPASNLNELVNRQQLDGTQHRIIVPISEIDLAGARNDSFLIRNRLRTHLFSRDLFDVAQPITSDLYFFGRGNLVNELCDGVKAGKNYGLFGLRKMGKTSLIFKLRRMLEQNKLGALIYFDLQSPEFYRMPWWRLIDRIRLGLPTGASLGPDSEGCGSDPEQV